MCRNVQTNKKSGLKGFHIDVCMIEMSTNVKICQKLSTNCVEKEKGKVNQLDVGNEKDQHNSGIYKK